MRVDVAEDRLDLIEPNEFTRLSVRLPSACSDRRSELMARVGLIEDDDHVLIDAELLRGLAGERAQDRAWETSLRQMIEVARRHGWVHETGRIRAHVEVDT